MTRAARWLSICACVALVAACGGGAGAGASFSTSPAAGGPCATFTASLCGYLMTCRGVPYCGLPHCLADNECAGFSALARALDAGAVTYDAARGAACLARFASDPCSFGALPASLQVFDVLARCPGALAPRLPSGAACVSSAECASGLWCSNAGVGCAGVCAPFALAGQGCGAGAPCADGLTCDATGVCRPAATATTEGAACGATADAVTTCAAGLWCDAAASGAVGACRVVGGAGAPCSDLGGCAASLHCVANACAPPGAVGDACELSGDCAAGLVCDGGACALPFDVGHRCRADGDCLVRHTGATEKCLVAACPGDDCGDPNAWCVLGVCRAGRCATRGRSGAPCTVGGDCASGTCVSGTCAEAVCGP